VWARAQDRYENAAWYRDFAEPRGGAGRSRRFHARTFWGRSVRTRDSAAHVQALRQVSSGIQILQQHFGVRPTTLVCPQNVCTHEAIESALDYGLHQVAGGALGIRDHHRLCWVKHVPTRFLDAPEIGAFEGGLPVAVLFHDKDLALEGVRWMKRWLAAWDLSGARKLLDLRELAATVSRRLRLEDCSGSPRLRIEHEDAPQMVRPIPVHLRVPGNLPPVISSVCGKIEALSPVEPIGNGCGRMMLTPDASWSERP